MNKMTFTPCRYKEYKTQYLEFEYDSRESYYEEMRQRERYLIELTDSKELENCREHYMDGIGTRKWDKMVAMNFGMDQRETVVAYSTDSNGKVIRVWRNKYDDPKGDSVGESVCWPLKVGQQSTRWLTKEPYRHCEG